jgi:hypothetical protein
MTLVCHDLPICSEVCPINSFNNPLFQGSDGIKVTSLQEARGLLAFTIIHWLQLMARERRREDITGWNHAL